MDRVCIDRNPREYRCFQYLPDKELPEWVLNWYSETPNPQPGDWFVEVGEHVEWLQDYAFAQIYRVRRRRKRNAFYADINN